MFVTSMFAYVLSVRSFWLNRPLTWLMFFTMLFGGGLVPSYIVNVRYLHLDNTVWIFLLPGLIGAYNVIILRTFIRTSIPDGLFDAAKLMERGILPYSSELCSRSPKPGWLRWRCLHLSAAGTIGLPVCSI